MYRKTLLAFAMTFFIFLTSLPVFAQLVDWERYNKYQKQREESHKQSAQQMKQVATSKINQKTSSVWKTKDIKVISDEDRRYDVNRDGFLQSSESKVYLKRVVDEAERKGKVVYRSDLLKEYDVNKDGFISQEEASKILAELF